MTGHGPSGACPATRRSRPARQRHENTARKPPPQPSPARGGGGWRSRCAIYPPPARGGGRDPRRRRGRVGAALMAQLDDVITYLEMKARPVLPRMPAPPAKLALIRTENC